MDERLPDPEYVPIHIPKEYMQSMEVFLRENRIPLGGVVILYTEAGSAATTSTVPELTGLSISEVNQRAINSGYNIKVAGATFDGQVVSYRQSIEKGTKAELGTTITVYFKATTGVEDN